jgi:uncharacterized protein (TIGR03435 family)
MWPVDRPLRQATANDGLFYGLVMMGFRYMKLIENYNNRRPGGVRRSGIWVVSAALLGTAVVAAQAPDGGSNLSFDTATVKPSTLPKLPDFPLDVRNAKTKGGHLDAAFPLFNFIAFACKLNAAEARAALSQAPKWVAEDRFEINATAKGDPTKDQLRVMMQTLLSDRFKLKVHFENKDIPVMALTLVTPGKTGPKLRPHAAGPPCPDAWLAKPGTPAGDVFPPNCDSAAMWDRKGMRLIGDRNTSMALLADAIYSYGNIAGEVDKPVLDKTGLDGTYDFTLEYAPPAPASPQLQADRTKKVAVPKATPFLNAMRDQLGLKLAPSKGPLRVLVIDHVEKLPEEGRK